MDTFTDDSWLPADVETQPVVQAAAALRAASRNYKDVIEQEQRLAPALVAQLKEAGVYRMVIPRSLGGLQADPLTYLRAVELLSEGCGSVGWNVCNNSIAQLVTLGMPDDGVAEIHGKGPSIIAGTAVQGGGQGVAVPGGYRITGHWTFGTGCQEASWMLGSFQILDDGTPRTREDGSPAFWRCVVPRKDVTVLPGTWQVEGLRGTGSFDWTVTDLFVPEHRTCPHVGVPLDNQWSRWPGLTYALPSQCWVGPHHSSVITGIARAGIDALVTLTMDKKPRGRSFMLRDNPMVQEAVGRADAILNAGRGYRSATIADIWHTMARGEDSTLEQRSRARLASTYAADSARQAMDMVFRHGGSTSFKSESRLAEAWRDLQVVGQTATIAPEWYPIAGRALMGMDPGPRLR